MIDWDKPIETMDGRKARKIQTVQNELWNIVFVPGENFGDVFLINAEGCICGDRTNFSAKREPFIRNARVKREGWVLVEPKKNRTLNNIVAILGTLYVYPTEKEALRAIEYHNMDLETKAVFFQWEEYP